MKTLVHLASALVLVLPAAFVSAADPHAGHMAGHTSTVAAAPTASMSEGEVKRIDKQAGKITIKHGPLVNLDMPPMTMVFAVKDAALLDRVQTGDKIRFVAEKNGAKFQVAHLERAQ